MTWFLIKHQFVFYAGYLQGYTLDNDVVFVSEGEKKHFERHLPTFGNLDDGYLRQTRVDV
jgi:hypothetical protein